MSDFEEFDEESQLESERENENDEDDEQLLQLNEDEDDEEEEEDENNCHVIELPISILSSLQLNVVYQTKLRQLESNLAAKLRENRSRQEDLKSLSSSEASSPLVCLPGHGRPNSMLPFMANYFKDVNGQQPPPNEDLMIKHRNGEINAAYLCPNKPCNKREKRKLVEQVFSLAKRSKLEPLCTEKEKLTKNKEKLKNPEVKAKIKALDAEINKLESQSSKFFIPHREDDSEIDWNHVATAVDSLHTAKDCQLRWRNELHPDIDASPWTTNEDEALRELVDTWGVNNWDLIATQLGSRKRLPWQICSRYQSKLNKEIHKAGPMSREEAEIVLEKIRENQIGNYIPWHRIGYQINGRSLSQIKHFWRKYNTLKRGETWNELEDKILRIAVKKYGKHNWRKVSYYLPGRNNMQCRERYMLRLDIDSRKLGDWTDEEDELLLKFAPQRKWVEMQAILKGRNAAQIAARYEKLCKYRQRTKPRLQPTRKIYVNLNIRREIRAVQQQFGIIDEDDDIDEVLRKGRAQLQKKLEEDKAKGKYVVDGFHSLSSNQTKSSVTTDDEVDAEICAFFEYDEYCKNLLDITDIERSPMDCEEEQRKIDVVNEALKMNISTILNCAEDSGDQLLDKLIDTVFREQITSSSNDGFDNLQPFFPPNRYSLRAMQGLMLQKDVLDEVVRESNITQRVFEAYLARTKQDIADLDRRFSSLFFWPMLISQVKLSQISQSTINWSSAMEEEDRSDDEEDANETKRRCAWFLKRNSQSDKRQYYKPKTANLDTYVYTRVRPRT